MHCILHYHYLIYDLVLYILIFMCLYFVYLRVFIRLFIGLISNFYEHSYLDQSWATVSLIQLCRFANPLEVTCRAICSGCNLYSTATNPNEKLILKNFTSALYDISCWPPRHKEARSETIELNSDFHGYTRISANTDNVSTVFYCTQDCGFPALNMSFIEFAEMAFLSLTQSRHQK